MSNKLTAKEIHDECLDIMSETLSKTFTDVEITDRLVEDLGADSLDRTAIMIEATARLGVDFSETEEEKIITFGDFVNVVTEVLKRENRFEI